MRSMYTSQQKAKTALLIKQKNPPAILIGNNTRFSGQEYRASVV